MEIKKPKDFPIIDEVWKSYTIQEQVYLSLRYAKVPDDKIKSIYIIPNDQYFNSFRSRIYQKFNQNINGK